MRQPERLMTPTAGLSRMSRPTQGDPSSSARVTGRIVHIALVSGVATVAAGFAFRDGSVLYSGAACATLALGLLVLLRHGRVKVAVFGACFGFLAVAFVSMYLGYGAHDVAIVLLPMTVVVGALLLDRRRYDWLVVGCVGVTAILGVLDQAGLRAARYPGSGQWYDILLLGGLLIAAGFLTRVLVESMHANLLVARQHEKSFREILDATNDAVFVHDGETGAILDVNQQGVEWYGYTREQLLERSMGDLSSTRSGYTEERARAMLERARMHGRQNFEWLARRCDGSEFWVEIWLRTSEIGGEGRVLSVVRDIDERKRRQERLRQAEKLRAVGELAGGVAHDLNNQLTGISGCAELLHEAVSGQPQLVEYAEGVLTGARRASDLTKQLLAFARKGKFLSVAVDVHKLVTEVVQLLGRSIDKRIEIETVLGASTATTMGDPTQLQNALLNLALNARDAMPHGGKLTFRTRTVEISGSEDTLQRSLLDVRPGPFLELEVTDTGMGMSAEARRRLFEPFFTTKEKGTGMGLAAVYGTLRAHLGMIEVDTKLGAGSTFRLLLPVASTAGQEAPVEDARERAPVVSSHLLVIDDEELVAKVATRVLGRAGYRVTASTSARAALEAYRLHWPDFDLVLLDLVMPALGGLELFSALRAINPQAAVLVVSGFSRDGEAQRILDSGAVGFLQKPFSRAELLNAVREALEASRKQVLPRPRA